MSNIMHSLSKNLTKPVFIIGGCAVLGLSAYAFYSYYKNRSRMVDEGFVDISVIDDSTKKILVLGLDGAGKSTFLSHLRSSEDSSTQPENTKGFSVVSVQLNNGKSLNFWEIGGSENIRIYWTSFVQDTDLLIYIVDSADEHRLAESVKELYILTATEKLKNVPIFILANKQDIKKASSPALIAAAFGVPELSRHHKVAVFPLEMPPDENTSNKSVSNIKEVVTQLLFGK